MDVPSYVKPPPQRRFGLRERLMLGLLLGALGTIVVAVVGWISFQRVVSSQQAIVRETLPTADALHDAVRGNARLAALAPRLARADTLDELAQLRTALNTELPLIRERLAALDSPHVEPELRARLRATGDALAARLDIMADTIAARLHLRAARSTAARDLRDSITELEMLASAQTDNATALLVSTLTTVLQSEESTSLQDRNAARDRLLDVDLDTLERMHELVLNAHALSSLIERLDELDTPTRLQATRGEFESRLTQLARRLANISDPGARQHGAQLHAALSAVIAPSGSFDMRVAEIELRARSEASHAEVGVLTTELDALAGELIHRGGRILAAASLDAERSASSGVLAFGVIGASLLLVTALVIIQVLRRHTLGRLLALEEATLALASGKRDVRIDTEGDDELASLSRALARFRDDAIERDRLAEALRLQQQDLEHQVAARTVELSDSNAALAREMVEHASARVAAENADRAKTAFLGTVSHELRTPMAGILGLLEILKDTPTTPEQTRYLEQIRSAAVLLLELLEDMLDFARIEAGGVQVENTPFSLRDTVNDVFAVQGTRAAARGLTLVADIDSTVADTLSGDRRKLSQILLNLVGNAIKFSDEGAVTIHIAPGRGPNSLRFAVEDHGIGIDPARQREVFEPFVQVRDSGRHHGGTGLGLAVCKRLIEAMGGEISLISTPGRGTTVSFELAFELAFDPAPTAPEQALSPVPGALRPGGNVLLVEDDAVNRLVVERFLTLLDQHPVCATDIQSALAAFDKQAPDVALIDMNLPDGDGQELLSRLRQRPHGCDVPAVLMSAHVPAHEVQALLDAGFAAFLRKPFSRIQLQALLAHLLGGPRPATSQLNPHPAVLLDTAMAGSAEIDAQTPTSPEWVDAHFLQAEHDALGSTVLSQIADVFQTQGHALIAGLVQAAQSGDADECRQRAHKLRGAASNLGLEPLSTLAATLEQDILAGADTALVTRAQALETAYHNTLVALRKALANLTAVNAKDC